MKVGLNTRLADDEKRWTERPAGSSISFTQLTIPCDKRLQFRRQRVKVKSPLGVGLVFGRALHLGAEMYLRGAAKTPVTAIKAALVGLDDEVRKAENGPGLRWDEWHERNLDGSPSLKGSNFGSLPSIEFARYWLVRQLALWLLLNGDLKVRYSEHRIFVPLTAKPNWTQPWSLESWLDLVVDLPQGGYGIVDLKSAGSPWGESDLRKYVPQATLYQAAAERDFKEAPGQPFEFHVLPRAKAALPALQIAHAWVYGDLDAEPLWPSTEVALDLLLQGGPVRTKTVTEGRGKAAVKREVPILDEDGQPVREWVLADAAQVVPVKYDTKLSNAIVKGMIQPKIDLIEAGAFVADPTGWWCSARWCDYHSHCAFGTGTHL